MRQQGVINVTLSLLGLTLLTATSAGQAASLSVGFIGQPCDVCVPQIRTAAGDPVPVTLAALDSSGNLDPNYRGTVTFSSSDALATLPSPYTFTAADAGGAYFPQATIFNSPGRQTLTVADNAGGLSATTSILVVGQAAAVPMMTKTGAILIVGLLGGFGVWSLSRP